jgi:hypothetical protein
VCFVLFVYMYVICMYVYVNNCVSCVCVCSMFMSFVCVPLCVPLYILCLCSVCSYVVPGSNYSKDRHPVASTHCSISYLRNIAVSYEGTWNHRSKISD